MIYAFLRLLIRFFLRIFYREISLAGVPDPGGPLVLVANHPNTLMDALLIASRYSRKVSIIAKGSLFSNPFYSMVFRSVGALPVMRRQELGPKADPGQSNDDTFLACYEELQKGGIILIFGEGTSHAEPRLMPLKTGAARIALGAEEKFGPLDVHIVPVGLTYEAPELFGERVRLCFSDPLPVSPFLKRAGDSREAARQLTRLIEACLEKAVVHLEDHEFEDVLVTVDRWIGHRLVNEERHRLDATRAIADALNHFHEKDPARVVKFQEALGGYDKFLIENSLSDEMLEELPPFHPGKVLAGFLIFPFWMWGAVNHFVPYQVPRLLCGLLKFDRTYTSTIKLLTGILSFVACYALQSVLVFYYLGNFLGGIYLGTLPVFGVVTLLALQYYDAFQKRRKLLEQQR
ncbi:MAG: lysophospholipid acyltransferase family protein, partial [Planctomycetota bacterium]|nr:lysophospholipid acyltransferase family protein [Planctomycetota bacterium]